MSAQEIATLYIYGKAQRKDYMIVMQDSFDYEIYPVYASRSEVRELFNEYSNKSDILREVYDLNGNFDVQMAKHRVMDLPPEE